MFGATSTLGHFNDMFLNSWNLVVLHQWQIHAHVRQVLEFSVATLQPKVFCVFFADS